MNETKLLLFTRPDCHLCEVAAKLLDAQELGWRARNIDKDLDLIQRYGDKVPVLFHAETKAELAWPFDGEGLERFLGIVA